MKTKTQLKSLGAYSNSIVIQFQRQVKMRRFNFESGEFLVLNNIDNRLARVRTQNPLDYDDGEIPKGSYQFIGSYPK